MFQWGYPQTWDYQWTYTGMCQRALAIVPCENQVSNIEFDATAKLLAKKALMLTTQKKDSPEYTWRKRSSIYI